MDVAQLAFDTGVHAVKTAKALEPVVSIFQDRIRENQMPGFIDLWYNTKTAGLHLSLTENADDRYETALNQTEKVAVNRIADLRDYRQPQDSQGSWVKIAERHPALVAADEMTKTAKSDILETLGGLTGWNSSVLGDYAKAIPGWPSPAMAALTSGVLGAGLGAGLGYGGSKLASPFLAPDWDKKRLSTTATILGGLLGGGMGAAPGLLMSYGANKAGYSPWDEQLLTSTQPVFKKQAVLSNPIDVTGLQNAIWGDPRVADKMDIHEKALLSGLMGSAAASKGPSTQFVTPMDMGRVTAGMGTGYASGVMVGKVLGTLTGMPQNTQDRLREAGIFSGMIRNVLPQAFSR